MKYGLMTILIALSAAGTAQGCYRDFDIFSDAGRDAAADASVDSGDLSDAADASEPTDSGPDAGDAGCPDGGEDGGFCPGGDAELSMISNGQVTSDVPQSSWDGSDYLVVRCSAVTTQRALTMFDLSPIPECVKTLKSAIAVLTRRGTQGLAKGMVWRVDEAWNEGVFWNNQPKYGGCSNQSFYFSEGAGNTTLSIDITGYLNCQLQDRTGYKGEVWRYYNEDCPSSDINFNFGSRNCKSDCKTVIRVEW